MRILRILFTLAVVLVVVAALGVGGLWYASDRALAARVDLPASSAVSTGAADTLHGAHLVTAVMNCIDCHGANLGGAPFFNDGAMGTLPAPNLTSGKNGIAARYTDSDFSHAIRDGVRPDGTRLIIMPAGAYQALSDADLRDVIAFVRSAAPVDFEPPPRALGPVARMLLVTGKLSVPADEINHAAPHDPALVAAVTPDYGHYIARIAGCLECHGANLAGGHFAGSPDDPAASNITPGRIGKWTLADFTTTIRTGKDPNGHELNPFMPWRNFAHMTDAELNAVWQYLQTVPPVQT